MKISAKTEYACIAMLELADRYDTGEPVCIRDIADTHRIPARFLVQILLQLKGAGLVASTRGASGGYQLIRDPEQITLADVMAVIDGLAARPSSNVAVETPVTRTLFTTWCEASDAEHEVLSAVTFADLLQRAQGSGEMYYI